MVIIMAISARCGATERQYHSMASRIILNETSYHGAGAVKEIVGELAHRGLKKPIVFSDPELVKRLLAKIDQLEAENRELREKYIKLLEKMALN